MKKILFLCLLFSTRVNAHPVAYKDSTSFMTWNQSFMSDHWIVHSFKPNMAIAGRFMRMEMPEGRIDYSSLQFNYLLYRNNETHAQSNIYIYGGMGGVRFDQLNKNTSGGAGLIGVEMDSESRKYFALLKLESMRGAVAPDFDHVEMRLGVAPYEADYLEMASWFMIQTQWHPNLEKQIVVTPLARFFYKSVLWETGVSLEGDWMMNFMFHF